MALLAMVVCLAGLAGRLFWIQVVSATSYASRKVNLIGNSVAQREKGIVLDSGRGDFYDRRMQPLTGQTVQALVVFPVRRGYGGSEAQLDELSRILGVARQRWDAFVSGVKEPQFWTGAAASGGTGDGTPLALTDRQAEQIRDLNIPGVKVFDYKLRYPADSVARQLIGFIGENPQLIRERYAGQLASGEIALTTPVGGSGLERSFDALIRGIGPTSISFFTDGSKRPLDGLGTRIVSPQNPFYPLKLVTSLDLDIQRKTEALLDRLGFREGAVVVLDAANADVVAMVSRPQYDRQDIHPERQDWSNHALKALIPGSVFKTVVAAAALEAHAVEPQETFECDGELGKYGFSCWKKGGHGLITFEEAFAESCNITFAKVMERLTASQLEEAAAKLGLGRTVGWTGSVLRDKAFHQFDAEEAGQVFAAGTPKDDDGVKVQTAIGQRDVRISPLQAANLVVTLLHHGEVRSPRVVKEVRYRNDRIMLSFPEKTLVSRKDGISRKTADTLLQWMEEVVRDGTGQALQSAKWKLAGKSGTAQVVTAIRPTVNQWFVGYGPVESPRYAVAVVAQDVPADQDNQALQAFKGVMNILAGQ